MSKDLKNFADRIKHMVRDFVNTGDISRINRDVTITVNSALETAFEEVRKAVDSIRAGTRFNEDKSASSFARQPWYPRYGEMKQQPRQAAKFPHVPVGRVAGLLYAVSGGVGLGLLGVVTALLFAFGTVNLINAVGLAAFFVACVSLEIKGSVIRNRLRRYKKYLGLLDGRTSCMIKELAIYSGHSEKFILKDFRKMISLGMFPQAHIDDEKTLIMLNNEVYERYLAYQAEYKVRKARELEEQESGKKKPATGTGPEIRNAVEEGRKYIRQIREAKFDISNAAVSAKIQRLEGTIGKIIEHVEVHPKKLADVRRFMAYYLPTTVKLLDAYREFDRQPIQGENIKNAKKEINDALDTINTAFENLFDSLFEDAAWSVSADITVLNTMLKQEGLTGNDFKHGDGGSNPE